jgi:hypothetical protein
MEEYQHAREQICGNNCLKRTSSVTLPYDRAKSANNTYENVIKFKKKKKNAIRKYLGLFIYPVIPVAALPNLVRLSLKQGRIFA